MEILSKLPKEIRAEVISFHTGQWIADNQKEWEEEHRWNFEGCLRALMRTTGAIRDRLKQPFLPSDARIKHFKKQFCWGYVDKHGFPVHRSLDALMHAAHCCKMYNVPREPVRVHKRHKASQ
jgi:hypothetical protein